MSSLRVELPHRLRLLQAANIAPVDLAQSAIGPGMEVFSRYSQVLESDGSPMRISDALGIINLVLEEVLAEQEGELDPETRWAVAWFEQFGMEDGEYGQADILSKAKNASVDVLSRSGIVKSGTGKVRLQARNQLPSEWDPASGDGLTIWEATQRLVLALEDGGETAAGELAIRLGGDISDRAKTLAYRLYDICERKGWSEVGLPFNALAQSWPGVLNASTTAMGPVQGQLLEQ